MEWVLAQSFKVYAVSNNDADNRYLLTIKGYFQLLQYEDLNNARLSSKRAMYIAVISIVISTISLGFTIIRGCSDFFK